MPHSDNDNVPASGAAARLAHLRAELKRQGLAGFIVPKSDAFQNESVPPHEDRLAWLTGFSGSAGVAVVLLEKAALIVDSRYTLQAKAQADAALYSVELAPKVTTASYLGGNAAKGDAIGYDPRLHTLAGFKPLRDEAEKRGFVLRPCEENPMDAIWTGRPKAAHAPIFLHDEKFAGESAASKLARVQREVKQKGAAGLFIGAPDSIAWLLNIRGRDVARTPIPLVRAFVPLSGKPTLFVSDGHIARGNRQAIKALADVQDIGSLGDVLPGLIEKDARIMADPGRTTLHAASVLERSGAKIVEAPDPCTLFKARKNSVELEGARAAHRRDGVALCRFLAWLDASALTERIDELAAEAKLETFRLQTNALEDLSFDTISGAGPNGAIVHYRATEATNRPLTRRSLYLVDSGAQYVDGTTDVTRTVAIGLPTTEMKRHFTLVLKGHIALATALFPAGTRGVDLDPFARRALWAAGLNYGHGTGHGVGSFLSVHEGPQSISPNGMAALEPGMIVSNEPGYYREGHYGIRIENLMAVTEPQPVADGEAPMLGFETLTLAPIDRRLIVRALLSADEKRWLDDYHARVCREIAPQLDPGERAWLEEATKPLRGN